MINGLRFASLTRYSHLTYHALISATVRTPSWTDNLAGSTNTKRVQKPWGYIGAPYITARVRILGHEYCSESRQRCSRAPHIVILSLRRGWTRKHASSLGTHPIGEYTSGWIPRTDIRINVKSALSRDRDAFTSIMKYFRIFQSTRGKITRKEYRPVKSMRVVSQDSA
jgi:hypothetical protein